MGRHHRDHAADGEEQDGGLAREKRFMRAGVDGLLRDKTRPSRVRRWARRSPNFTEILRLIGDLRPRPAPT